MHVITGLDTGGAERVLLRLLSSMDRAEFELQVVSLTDRGTIGPQIEALGIPVRSLNMRRGMPGLLPLTRLARCIANERPDLIQTWMYHADLLGGLAAFLAGRIPVAWNLRQSNLDRGAVRPGTIAVAWICARLSHSLPARIVCGSEAAARAHAARGYATSKMTVIPNGFDLNRWRPDPDRRAALRAELGVPHETPVVGLVARFDPQKHHQNFVQAAALLHNRRPDVHFLLCGGGVDCENAQLSKWVRDAGVEAACHLMGERRDLVRIVPGLDIAVSSSYSEGFPNAIGEAMACGIPCGVTDAGDSALMVGEAGRVAPVRNPGALAECWLSLLELPAEDRQRLGRRARQRVEEQFSLSEMVARYERLYRELALHPDGQPAQLRV